MRDRIRRGARDTADVREIDRGMTAHENRSRRRDAPGRQPSMQHRGHCDIETETPRAVGSAAAPWYTRACVTTKDAVTFADHRCERTIASRKQPTHCRGQHVAAVANLLRLHRLLSKAGRRPTFARRCLYGNPGCATVIAARQRIVGTISDRARVWTTSEFGLRLSRTAFRAGPGIQSRAPRSRGCRRR